MTVFPRNHIDVSAAGARIRAIFADFQDKPCVILTGQTKASPPPGAVVFWIGPPPEAGDFLDRIDGHFCEGLDPNRDSALLGRINRGLRITAFFRPDLPGTVDGAMHDLDRRLQPLHDPWTLLVEHPTLARFLMGRPMPAFELQVLAFAAVLGFRDIHLGGIALRNIPGHGRDLDLMFLRALRACFELRISGLPKLDVQAPAPVPPCAGAGRHAYATLVVGSYIFGAMALARSLARVSDAPLIVLHAEPEVAGRLAHLPNVILHPIEFIPNPNSHGRAILAPTYSKLRVFDLLDYNRIVFIDADCVALQSPDGLFATTGFCAAPNWGIGLSMQTFNSGVFAFSPSKDLRERVMANITRLPSNTGGDQGYLNSLLGAEWTPLPPEYNTLTRQPVLHPTLTSLSDVRLLHFAGAIKPWAINRSHGEYAPLVDLWLGFLESEDWRLLYWSYNRRIVREARSVAQKRSQALNS